MTSNNNTTIARIDRDEPIRTATLVENTKVEPKYSSDLMVLAEQIQKADQCVKSNVTNKLSLIADQILFLQEQAKQILEKAKLEMELHSAACNLAKKPGNIYYYYKRASGQNYLSIMSPTDWGVYCPHEFLAAYRLENDNSWTPVDDLKKFDDRKSLIQQVMSHKLAIKDAIY